jgi:predicted TIM-barrel fold metal-dependent hydrolase
MADDPNPVVRIVDAHHHLWDLSSGRYPWLQGPAEDPAEPNGLGQLQRNYVLEDLDRDTAAVPVVATVHVEAARHPSEALAETRWVQSCAGDSTFVQAIVVAARLQSPRIEEELNAHLLSPNVRGVRQMLNWAPEQRVAERPNLMADSQWRRGLSCLEALGLSFDLQVFPHQLEDAATTVRQFPSTTFILNHGGFLLPDEPDRRSIWRQGMKRLARNENVFVKISSYASLDPTMDTSGLRAFVGEILEMFGSERAMFASNFPVDRRFISYDDLVVAYSRAAEDLTASERDAFFCTNALARYRIVLPKNGPGPAN